MGSCCSSSKESQSTSVSKLEPKLELASTNLENNANAGENNVKEISLAEVKIVNEHELRGVDTRKKSKLSLVSDDDPVDADGDSLVPLSPSFTKTSIVSTLSEPIYANDRRSSTKSSVVSDGDKSTTRKRSSTSSLYTGGVSTPRKGSSNPAVRKGSSIFSGFNISSDSSPNNTSVRMIPGR